jgi:hypothetical protein
MNSSSLTLTGAALLVVRRLGSSMPTLSHLTFNGIKIMKCLRKQISIFSVFAILSSSMWPVFAVAAEYDVALHGEVTKVTDELNWFNDSIQVGMPVDGTYNFFDAGYRRSENPPSSFFEFYFQPNSFGFPVLPAKMKIAIGGNDYQTAPGSFFYGISVINDSNGSGFYPAGDGYRVQSPLPFPAHFTDWAGDPVVDPDGNFYAILGMSLQLADTSGTALASTDLPLGPPDLNRFASAIGTIFIADGNGAPNYAVAEFRITSLQSVPEPSSLIVCGIGLIITAGITRRSRSICLRKRKQQYELGSAVDFGNAS